MTICSFTLVTIVILAVAQVRRHKTRDTKPQDHRGGIVSKVGVPAWDIRKKGHPYQDENLCDPMRVIVSWCPLLCKTRADLRPTIEGQQ